LSRWPVVCSRVLTLLGFAFASRPACCEPKLVVDLDYRTDTTLAGCPSDAAFRTQVRSQLGYDPFRGDSAQKVVARAAADSQGIQGFVRWYDAEGTPRGERELTSPNKNCAAFARAMSFAIAVQIQLLNEEAANPTPHASEAASEVEQAAETPGKAPATPPPRSSRASPAPGSGASTAAADGQRPRWQFMIGAGPALRFGVSPRATAEGRIFAAVRRDLFAVEVGADASLPTRNPTTEGAGFEVNLAGGSLAGCGFLGPFAGCLVNRWGRLGVRGFGVDVPHASSGLVAQLGPRLVLNGSFAKSWKGAVRIEALVALSPWRVILRGQEVWRAPPLSLAVGVDLLAVFNDNP